jgi:hypothetical protein
VNTKHLRMMVDSDDDQDVPRAIFSAADELDRRAAEIEQLQADVGRLQAALRQAESSYSETLLQLGATSKERDQMKASLLAFKALGYADPEFDSSGSHKLACKNIAEIISAHDAEVIRAFVEAVKRKATQRR